MQSAFAILSVPLSANNAEIKAAYRRLVKLYHPDSSSGLASAEKFKEVQKAYEAIKTEARRSKYINSNPIVLLNEIKMPTIPKQAIDSVFADMTVALTNLQETLKNFRMPTDNE